MREDQWEVALDDGDIKRMTVEQLDDAFRLGIVRDSTMVRQVGRPQWLSLSVAAGLDNADEPASQPAPTPVAAETTAAQKPERKFGVGAAIAVPRPRGPRKESAAPPRHAYSSRVPPPVTMTRSQTGETSRPQIPMATITRSLAPPAAVIPAVQPPPVPELTSSAPPPLAPLPMLTVSGPPAAPEAPQLDPNRTALDLAPVASEADDIGAPSPGPPPLPPGAFYSSPAAAFSDATPARADSPEPASPPASSGAPPLPPGAFAAPAPALGSPEVAAAIGLAAQPSPSPVGDLELARPVDRGSPWATAVVVVAAAAGLLIVLQRSGVLADALGTQQLEEKVLGAPSIFTPRGVARLIAQSRGTD